MKHDRQGHPYRNLVDRLRSPKQRFDKAIASYDCPMVVELVKSKAIEPNHRLNPVVCPQDAHTDSGFSLLHWMVINRFYDGCRALLEVGADPNIATFFKETPSHWAGDEGDEDMLFLLFEHGADLSLQRGARGRFVVDDNPYNPTPLELFNMRTQQRLTIEDLSAKLLNRRISQNIEEERVVSSSKRKM